MKKLLQRKNLILLIETGFFVIICWYMCHVPEVGFEVPRQLLLGRAVIAMLLLIAFLRNINFKDIKAWIFVILSGIALCIFWKYKNINADFYGEIYSVVVRQNHVIYAFSIGLLLDLLRHRPVHLKYQIKTPLFWLYILFTAIGCYFANADIIPLLTPIYALILTDIDSDKWVELTEGFGVAYYLVFAYMFTRSLILEPDNFVSGRYVGVFLNTSTTGATCGIAVLIGLGFFIRWLRSERNIKRLIVLCVFWAYPILATLMVNSRTIVMAIALAILTSFIFLHGKEEGVTKKRIFIGLIILGIVIITFLITAFTLAYLVKHKYVGLLDLPYGLAHVAEFGYVKEGYFDIPILNKINRLTSERVRYWAELMGQIKLKGQVDALLYTHNLYLCYLIKYGLIGGLLMTAWGILYVISSMVRALDKNPAMILPLLYGVFAGFSELSMNGYWNLPLGMFWLILQYPIMTYTKKRSMERENITEIKAE